MILPNQPQQFNKQQREKRINPMIKMMNRISSTAMLAVAFVLCATSAWAGLVAEWNGDFGVTQKNGWTLTVGTGNTFANGVITIGVSSTTPVTIAHSTGYQRVTVVVGIKTSSADTVGTVVSPVYGNNASPYAYLDAENSSSQIWYGWYDGSTYDDDWDNDNTVTWSNDSVQYVTFVADTATASGTEPRGSTIYHNGSVVDGRKNGLVSSNAYVTKFGVGGNVGRNSTDGMLNGAEITYIAIYDAALTSSTTPTVAQASADPTHLMYHISCDNADDGGILLANDHGYGPAAPSVWTSGYRCYGTGKFGNAAQLHSGTLGLVDNEKGLGLNTTDGFTISFWGNLNFGSSDEWKSFFALRIGDSNFRLEKQGAGNDLFAMYYFNATTASEGSSKFSDLSYVAGEWSHYAFVFAPNNGNLTVYKDGALVKTVDAAADMQGTLYQVGIGRGRNGSAADSALRGNAPSESNNVLIDDLAIFKGALTDAQIASIAASDSAITGHAVLPTESININFTYDNKPLTTTDAVGISESAVKGTYWQNIAGSNGTTSPVIGLRNSMGDVAHVGGSSLQISGSSGAYRCNNLTSGSDLRHGYIDDNANNTTPTVTISEIPYDYYRLILYHACDSSGDEFGYDTVNGVNYTGQNGAVNTANFTKIGNADWGKTGGADTANALGEGSNFLTTPIQTSKTLTVAAHRTSGARSGLAALQVIPVDGVESVSFATPDETVWATANLPTYAKATTSGSGTISYANSRDNQSIVNGKWATVANVTGGSFDEIDGYIQVSETAATTRDIYLRVAGSASASRVNGIGETHWTGTRTCEFTGNVLVNMTGNATADFVMGGYKGGDPSSLTGDVGIVVDGNAVVNGSILGGWSSVHNYTPLITGNTFVEIKNVQGTTGNVSLGSVPTGYIIGGSAFQGNGGRSNITKNTSVIIDLPNEAEGTFVKGIVGGSYGDTGTATTIGGSSSVAITAPNAVTFSGNIIGGCWANSGTASVGGNTSIALNGGTYTGTIYAGGYGNGTPTVTGNATLTLNGGVYSSATLLPGTASGTKAIVISGDTDLSGATIGAFDEFAVDATKTLTLGTKRLVGGSDPTLASTSAGVVAFTLTAEEYAAGYANLMKCAGNDMTDKFVIYYNDEDITSSLADKVTVTGGHLVYLDASSYESTIAAETSVAWSDIVWTKADSSSATMASASVDASAEATLTVNGTLTISSPVTFAGILTIEGNGIIVFTGNASLSVGQELSIASGIALDFSGLTNLSNMGRDTIISAALGLEVNSSSTVFPSAWTCTSSTTSTGFIISGFKNASDSVNINIIGWDGASIPDNEDAGFYPVKGSLWNQILHQTATGAVNGTFDVSEVVADGTAKTDAGLSASVTASTTYSAETAPNNANAKLMKGYLNDGGSGANITVRNIPYSQYAVLIYVGTDSSNGSFRPITVNGTEYCGSGASTVSGSSNWGDYDSTRGTVTPTEGSNFLKVTGQTSSTLVIQGLTQSGNNRCSIAGIQIVNTGTRPSIYAGTINTSTATFAPSEGSTGITKTSASSWSNANTSRIVLTNTDQGEVALTIGESITTKSFRIVGSGKITLSLAAEKTITIADGTFDLSEFSGTLCVDSSISETLFAGVATNGGTVRFLGTNLSFAGAASLPLGRVALKSATLTGDLQLNNRTLVIEDGDSVILNGNNASRTSMQFAISGGSLTVKGGDFWFGNGSTFTQTGGTVTLESTSTSMSTSGCVIFGFSSGGGTVNISGGTFDMSGATLCLWTGTTSLTLSGNAMFKVKGIWSNASKNVTVGGSSKLILTGTQGISNNLGSLTMNGGTIEFQETATISEPLTLTSGVESTINVADTKSATISTVALSAVPAVGDKILATNGGTISINSVTVGGEAQSFDLCYESDGVYVAAAEYDSVNYYSVAAAIAVAGDANLADITLLNGCTTVPDGYYIEGETIAKYPAAIVYAEGDPDYYTTVQAAVTAANGKTYQGAPYEYVAVYANAAVTTAMTLKIKPINDVVVTVTVPGITSEYALNTETDEDGVITYTIDPAPTDYAWSGESGVWNISAVAPWRYGADTQATRAPSSVDTVVFASDAAVTVGENISVSSISVSSAITLTKASTDVTVTAATGGIVLTDRDATITVSGVTLSPAPTTNVGGGAKVILDGNTYKVVYGTIFSVY